MTIHVQKILQNLKKLKNVLSMQENRLKTAETRFPFADANYQSEFMTNLDHLSAQQLLKELHIAIKTQLTIMNFNII